MDNDILEMKKKMAIYLLDYKKKLNTTWDEKTIEFIDKFANQFDLYE